MENLVESVDKIFFSTAGPVEIRFVRLRPEACPPQRQTPGSAGLDLAACLDAPVTIEPGKTEFIPLGFAAELPPGCAAFVFSRSGLGARKGVVVAPGVGVIDSDYRGEWLVPLRNTSDVTYTVAPQERIAQAVLLPVLAADFVEAQALSDTQRGTGGFGSTSCTKSR